MRRSVWGRLVSFMLVLAMMLTVLSAEAWAQTVQGGQTQDVYIKSVKLAQASSAETAKKLLEADGYIFLDGNLNEGTGQTGVWMGYQTTTNPAEAIYDMKVMNMKGGFTLTSMKKALESQQAAFHQMAVDMSALIDEFVAAYEANSPAAQKAYKALNFFRMVNGETQLEEKNGLGYHLVNGGLSLEVLTELLLLCDSGILDSVIKILTMGIQGQNGNWMQKLSEKGPFDEDTQYADDDKQEELDRRAEQLLEILRLYANAYNAMEATGLVGGEFDEQFNVVGNKEISATLTDEEAAAKKLDENRYKFYKMVFDQLDTYAYGMQTLKDFFSSLPLEGDSRQLYPLVSVLTDGEFAAFSYGCFLEMASGVNVDDQTFDDYDRVYDEITKDVKSVYLYAGVDELLLQEDTVIGFTEAATRHMAATGEMEFYEKETFAEDAWETGKHVAQLIGAAGMGIMGLSKVTMGVTILVSWFSATAATSLESGILAGVVKVCALLSGMTAFIVTAVAVCLTILVAFIISAISEYNNNKIDWDDNPMPEYLYDVKEVTFTQTSQNGGVATEHIKRPVFALYHAVKDTSGDVVDLNARSGDATQWIAMYVSYDRQGNEAKPIKVEDLLVQTGNGETPEGYTPLSCFGEVIAYNLNQWDDTDRVNGIYVFYKQDTEVAVESDRTYYIYEVYLQQGESEAHCQQLLKASGYTPLNVNLTPTLATGDAVYSEGLYTYLGYKLTSNPASAITDLRLVYGGSQGDVRFGTATYAECGSNGVVTLYATKYKTAGTPLLAGGLLCVNDRHDAPAGYEPVNFFAGGPAVSLNVTPEGMGFDIPETYLYFLPSTTFTSGTGYLGGISYFNIPLTTMDLMNDGGKRPEMVLSYLKKHLGEGYNATDKEKTVMDYARLKTGYTQSWQEDGGFQDSVVYYETFNPYRAIYEVKATTSKDASDSFVFDGKGFTLWNRTQFVPNTPTYQERRDYFLSYNQQSKHSSLQMNGKVFVTGNPNSENTYDATQKAMKKVQPIKLSEFTCITKGSSRKPTDSMKPITDMFTESQQPVYLKNQKNLAKNEFAFYAVMDVVEKPYVSGISAIDELTLYRRAGGADKGLKRSDITDSMMISQLAAMGATNFCNTRVTMRFHGVKYGNEVNALRFGYTRSAKKNEALTDVFLYFGGFSVDEPDSILYTGNTKYTKLCEIPYNLTGYDGATKPGVYVYGTTDKDVGAPIIDFTVSETPFKEGYETVRTMNGRSLFAEIYDHMQQQEDNHIMYSGKTLFGWLAQFFQLSDDPTIAQASGLYYFHVKREGDALRVQKPYVEQLYFATFGTQSAVALDSLFDQGAEAAIETDLNSYAGGDYIYMGYRYTADPAKAIKEIRAYHQKNPPATLTDKANRKFTLASDLDMNKGAGGDYIYLYTTTEGATDNPVTALNVALKVSGTGDATQTWADGREFSVSTYCTKMWDSTKEADLNRGAGGDYVYVMYTVTKNAPMGSYEAPEFGAEKTYTRKGVTGATATGKYIAALYVMDKNTLRQEKLAKGMASSACTCDKISDQEVFDRLTAMGATTIIKTPIAASGNGYGKGDGNKVFIGYSRTDLLSKALKSIRIQNHLQLLAQPKETLTVNRDAYTLVAEAANGVTVLPSAINLLGLQDTQTMLLPRMYLYTSVLGDEPIYDICIDSSPIKNGWTTVKSTDGGDAFSDMVKAATKQAELGDKDDSDSYNHELIYTYQLYTWMEDLAELFDLGNGDITPFFIHCQTNAGKPLEEQKPYISEVFVAAGENKTEALANLIGYEPDGFVDCNLNQDAGGDNVYMAYKRVSDPSMALTDMGVLQGKNPEKTRLIKIDSNTEVKYDLVADVDLNKDAGGKYLYLYTTNSQAVGNPILNLSVKESTVSYLKCGIERVTAKRFDGNIYTDEMIDLNKGAGGDYLYLIMERETTQGHYHLKGTKIENTEATCGQDGSLVYYYTCLDCGSKVEKLVQVYKATGKHVDSQEDGDHDCDECGQTDVTAHVQGELQQESLIEATCNEAGSYHAVVYCTDCGMVLRDTEIFLAIDPTKHISEDNDHDCDICGALNIEGHTPGEPVLEGLTASDTDLSGAHKKVIYCSKCGAKLSEEIVTPADSNDLIASLFGNGSLVIVCSAGGLAVLAALIVFLKKKKKSTKK